MTATFHQSLFELPSARRFVENIIDDLANRRCVIVLTPRCVDRVGLKGQVLGCLWRREFAVEEVETLGCTPMTETSAPMKLIGHALRSAELLAGIPLFAIDSSKRATWPNVVLIDSELDLTSTGLWFQIVKQWADHSQRPVDRGDWSTALCLIISADPALLDVPRSDVGLAVHWWWGIPSLLEMRMLCRLNNRLDTRTIARWREYLLPSLAGSDIDLAECLWDAGGDDFEALLPQLRAFAERRDWSIVLNDASGLRDTGRFRATESTMPPIALRSLWTIGAVTYTLEHGAELSTAALALVGRSDEIRHRLWRAQTEFLLPLIDSIRLEICTRLTAAYGANWPNRWARPDSDEEMREVAENPLACQWGYLEFLLKTRRELGRESDNLPLVSLGRFLRNELAHYRIVRFTQAEEFLRLADRFIART